VGVSVRETIRTGRVAMCSSRLATLPSGIRGRSVRLLEPKTTIRAAFCGDLQDRCRDVAVIGLADLALGADPGSLQAGYELFDHGLWHRMRWRIP
jgi:hypothetical protein